jgi:hypothetical protein
MSATPERVDRAALIAEAKAWLADPCDEGCGDCGQEATSLISLLIAALESSEADARVARIVREPSAEDAAIVRIVRNPTQAEFLALGRAEWNARDILDRIVALAADAKTVPHE